MVTTCFHHVINEINSPKVRRIFFIVLPCVSAVLHCGFFVSQSLTELDTESHRVFFHCVTLCFRCAALWIFCVTESHRVGHGVSQSWSRSLTVFFFSVLHCVSSVLHCVAFLCHGVSQSWTQSLTELSRSFFNANCLPTQYEIVT